MDASPDSEFALEARSVAVNGGPQRLMQGLSFRLTAGERRANLIETADWTGDTTLRMGC